MQCSQCSSAAFARSHARGTFENLLFVWGAEIGRCLSCNSRQASLGAREIRLRDATGVQPQSFAMRGPMIAMGVGIVACALVAIWALASSHRLPF